MAYAKPTSVTLNSTYGRYTGGTSGVKYTVKGTTGYYVYAANPNTWTYYKKGTISSSSGLSIYLGANETTSDTYETYVILSSTDLGSSCTVGNSYSSYLYQVTVPYIVAKIYNGSSTLVTYDSDNYNLTTDLYKSGYGVLGFTASSTSKTPTYYVEDSPDGDGWQTGMDGKTLYTIHYKASSSSSATKYYYRGSSSKKSVTVTTTTSAKYLYGTGTTSGGTTSASVGSMTTTCLSNSSYSLQGWATSSSSKTVSYTDAADAYADGYSTIYGVYYKAASTSTNTVYYYRGSSAKQSVTETASTTAGYYYGTGSKSGGATSYSYGTITTSCLGDSSYSIVGWTGDSTSTTADYTDAEDAFNSYNTIYGIYKKAGSTSSSTCYYYRGDSTKHSVTKSTTIADAYLYGTGQSSGGTSSTSYGTITSDCVISGWEHIGWAYDETIQYSTLEAENLFNSGYSTIYGTYKKASTVTYYPQNGEAIGTSSIDDYRYGKGSVTSNVPQGPALTYDGYTFLGWATTADGSADTWVNQYNSGVRTVYAIWERDGNTYLGINGEWILLETYYGVNGEWVPIILKCGADATWK